MRYDVYSNDHIKSTVASMLKNGRLAHSFLIYGDSGLGKKTLATYIAMQLLCERQSGTPCLECRTCRNIIKGVHPDVIRPERSGKTRIYGTAAAEQTVRESIILPNDADRKVYIFSDCDSMNEAAQNKLLKVIEEPPDFTFFIFTAPDKSVFLPTVISRVMSFAAEPCSHDDTIAALIAAGHSPSDSEDAYLRFGGNIGRCGEYISGGRLRSAADIAHNVAEGIMLGSEYKILSSLYPVGSDRELYRMVITLLQGILRDSSAVRFGAAASGCDRDIASRLSAKLSLRRADRLYELCSKTVAEQDSNVSLPLSEAALTAAIMEALG